MIGRALISVSDKRGIVEFAKGLDNLGVELVSSGGTAQALREAGLPVQPVSIVTGFPEILDGRVKTLHPLIHGGILARRDEPRHRQQLAEQGIQPIDLVVVNLYPFEETVAAQAPLGEVIEQIDIGGPTLIRAAAKNHADVLVVVDPDQYGEVLSLLQSPEGIPISSRRQLALAAFRHTAYYDAVIAAHLGSRWEEEGLSFPARLTLPLQRVQMLRYGENPHQRAALYREPGSDSASLVSGRVLQGKALSYNNLQDAEAAWQLVEEFPEPAAVAVKHMNPCGVGLGGDIRVAYQRAYEADPVSIFGGIVALNRAVDGELAALLHEIFLEVIIAPDFSEEARQLLAKKKNLRLLIPRTGTRDAGWEIKRQSGGALLQEGDRWTVAPGDWQEVTGEKPTALDRSQLEFAWRVVKHVKSNAIVVARDGQTLGIGAGQMNRIDAARIALRQAGEKAVGAYLASDAFFPFADVVEEAARAGIRAIIQPGGSRRDEESIAAANQAGMVMLFTGERHFRH